MSEIKFPGVNENQVQLIKKIFNKYLGPKPKRFLFGSRIEGGFRKNSDLDILIQNESPIDFATLSKLKEEFEESSLPYKVDLMEWNRIPETIKASIEQLTKKEI
tara:strand:+ start:501 stop:812 length:312 start_codon:yes stop_codon:yes gene_type:complete